LAVVDEEQEAPGRNRDVTSMDPKGVEEAKKLELDRFESFGVYEDAPRAAALADCKKNGGKHITTRWEIQELGGQIRARFVAREFADTTTVDFFAPASSSATPRVIDAYALEFNLATFTFDASDAFLHVPEREYVLVKSS